MAYTHYSLVEDLDSKELQKTLFNKQAYWNKIINLLF